MIDTVAGAMDASQRPAEILDDARIRRDRSIKVAPKTVNQKRYVDSIRQHTVTFGSPRGRGLRGSAMAVAALDAREVSRITVPRSRPESALDPPGDIQAKVDPYLSPSSTPCTTCSTPSA